MDKYTEYCYNLMEAALEAGANGNGLMKDQCVAYLNMMAGIRNVQEYIKEHESDIMAKGEETDGKAMGN